MMLQMADGCGDTFCFGSQTDLCRMFFFAVLVHLQRSRVAVCCGLMECYRASVMKSNGKAGKWNSLKVRKTGIEQRIDHSQNDGLPATVGPVQQRYAVVQLEIDAMIVDVEEPIDLDSFEPSEFGFAHDFSLRIIEEGVWLSNARVQTSRRTTLSAGGGVPRAAFRSLPPCGGGTAGRVRAPARRGTRRGTGSTLPSAARAGRSADRPAPAPSG